MVGLRRKEFEWRRFVLEGDEEKLKDVEYEKVCEDGVCKLVHKRG